MGFALGRMALFKHMASYAETIKDLGDYRISEECERLLYWNNDAEPGRVMREMLKYQKMKPLQKGGLGCIA